MLMEKEKAHKKTRLLQRLQPMIEIQLHLQFGNSRFLKSALFADNFMPADLSDTAISQKFTCLTHCSELSFGKCAPLHLDQEGQN